jgi:ATP-dependent Clp protease ATP-binding subunit ClpC
MNLVELQNRLKEIYTPVFYLEQFISHLWRKKLSILFLSLWIIGLLGALSLSLLKSSSVGVSLYAYVPKLLGFSGIAFVVWLKFFLLEAFYFSYRFKDIREGELSVDFDLAFVLNELNGEDVTVDFFRTHTGTLVLSRAGIPFNVYEKFITNKKNKLPKRALLFVIKDNTLDLTDFLLALTRADKELSDFLFSFGIQNKELSGIAGWIEELAYSKISKERWWGKDKLSRFTSFGRDWSYGQIYTLKKYERPLSSGLYYEHKIHSSYGVKELQDLELTLSKNRDANVLLVGDDEVGKLEIIENLSNLIETGSAVAKLQYSRVIVLDTDRFTASNSSKASFEKEFINMMVEAINAGNIILVIDDLPTLMDSSESIGVNLPALIEEYLATPNLQVVALTDNTRFHEKIERNTVLTERFEIILIKEIDESNTIKVLQNEVVRYERAGMFFTYGSLVAIVDGAERYFPDGVMPDKAIDLLSEIVPQLASKGKHIVEKTDIYELIQEKTGIPVSGVSKAEKDKLLHLEEILHKQIVGQDEAVKTISNAVRRARSGITNPNRPLGSFLFLGPTGVGKTETTKALANVFFGEKAHILRLDMSEYSGIDALEKLIGSFESKQSGVLSTMIRENQYGVLLLDEFEKTTKEVMNLFLQILDEGFFSDMAGKKVMARNLIVIATSNAGSDMIWNSVQNKEDLTKIKDNIIDSIIKDGVFKPELLNRFDGVILFHPLNDIHLRKIGELMLAKLHDRLKEQGVDLVINEDLINYVVEFGTDPKFGARPMNRAIQEKVEEVVARKLIEGTIVKGQKFELSKEDLS